MWGSNWFHPRKKANSFHRIQVSRRFTLTIKNTLWDSTHWVKHFPPLIFDEEALCFEKTSKCENTLVTLGTLQWFFIEARELFISPFIMGSFICALVWAIALGLPINNKLHCVNCLLSSYCQSFRLIGKPLQWHWILCFGKKSILSTFDIPFLSKIDWKNSSPSSKYLSASN